MQNEKQNADCSTPCTSCMSCSGGNFQGGEILQVIPASEMRGIEEVLAYDNENVRHRLEDKLDLSPDEATILFADLRLFLRGCALATTRCTPDRRIDAAWHEFLMFTQDYQEFCLTFFGTFVHHVPFTRAEKRRARAMADATCGSGGGCSSK